MSRATEKRIGETLRLDLSNLEDVIIRNFDATESRKIYKDALKAAHLCASVYEKKTPHTD